MVNAKRRRHASSGHLFHPRSLEGARPCTPACIGAQQLALNPARRFGIQDPDAAHLSPAQIERQIELTCEVLLPYALAGRAQNNLASHTADFRPSLTRNDVYAILHATTDPQDQRAISALAERMRRFELEQGVDSPDLPSTESAPSAAQR